MDSQLIEWLNLTIRWVHVIVGIAWIGASFYFNWLENNLDRRNPRSGLSGDLWAIHGGGIYHLEKYSLAPPTMPETLHWFKWEAYSTWLSGFALLIVVYYLNAELYLRAPESALGAGTAVALGVASLIIGWLVYHRLCESALGQKPRLLGLILLLLIVAASYGLAQVFSGRGAFIHIGAIIGTLMVGNVFFVIMPAQRALVTAINSQIEPDPRLPGKALLRSRHNNYFTLPVLFIMISNHFPSTYAHHYNWAILAALGVLSVLVRHFFNTRHENNRFFWTLPAAALAMLALALLTAPASLSPPANNQADQTPVAFTTVYGIVSERCTVCHSKHPSHSAFSSAPGGVVMDSAEQIQQLAARIHAQAVATRAMPLGNTTGMTEQERQILGRWIAQGAAID